MTKSRYKQPLESFDPRLMQLLLKGSLGRINIPFLGPGGKKLAVAFQRRLQTLRARMRDADHEHAKIVTRSICRLLWGVRAIEEGLTSDESWRPDEEGVLGAYVSIQPVDLQFDRILSSLNLDFPEIVSSSEISPDETVSLDDVLGELPPMKED